VGVTSLLLENDNELAAGKWNELAAGS